MKPDFPTLKYSGVVTGTYHQLTSSIYLMVPYIQRTVLVNQGNKMAVPDFTARISIGITYRPEFSVVVVDHTWLSKCKEYKPY
ncbi:hypothetical protein [Fulvivirga imtechensis]|uniref:hypothetical protein n=1 Tax=Fulvivirga imtechensis TaxID=881893 RepID=UPI000685237E